MPNSEGYAGVLAANSVPITVAQNPGPGSETVHALVSVDTCNARRAQIWLPAALLARLHPILYTGPAPAGAKDCEGLGSGNGGSSSHHCMWLNLHPCICSRLHSLCHPVLVTVLQHVLHILPVIAGSSTSAQEPQQSCLILTIKPAAG